MTWFAVADTTFSDPRYARLRMHAGQDFGNCLALWTLAGSYCGLHGTGGFVDEIMLTTIWPGVASELLDVYAEYLCAELWVRVEGGYQFADWESTNPAADEEALKRLRAAERQRKRRRRARGLDNDCDGMTDDAVTPHVTTSVTPSVTRDVTDDVTTTVTTGVRPRARVGAPPPAAPRGRSRPDPTRPDPTRGGQQRAPAQDTATEPLPWPWFAPAPAPGSWLAHAERVLLHSGDNEPAARELADLHNQLRRELAEHIPRFAGKPLPFPAMAGLTEQVKRAVADFPPAELAEALRVAAYKALHAKAPGILGGRFWRRQDGGRDLDEWLATTREEVDAQLQGKQEREEQARAKPRGPAAPHAPETYAGGKVEL